MLIDESAQSNAIANSLLYKIKDIKKQMNSLGSGKDFSKSSYLSNWASLKSVLSTLMNLCSIGIKSASTFDLGVRTIYKRKVKDLTYGHTMTKSALIRDLIQILVSILIKFLSRKVQDSTNNDIVKTSKSVVQDLKKMKDETKDEKMIEYLDRQIDDLEEQIQFYEKEVSKK